MKCISCEIEINPQWKHAIDINVCPFCGKHIMEEHLKNLFSSLRETMEELQQYPDQLNDWMLSNHNYIKTDSSHLSEYMPKEMLKDLKKVQDDKDFQDRKKFTVKVKTEAGEEEIQAERVQSEEKTNEFFKRAEVIKNVPSGQPAPGASPGATPSFNHPTEKTQHFKKLVQQIKKDGAPSMNEAGEADLISPEMMDSADPEAVSEYQALMSGNEIVSALPDTGGDDIPEHILAANQAIANSKGGGGANAADLFKLQQMQQRLQKSKENFESGSNRGGKGGGFSRSG